MKKQNMIFGLLALAGSTILAACGAPESESVGPSPTETERNFAILASDDKGAVTQSGATISLLFKANSEIPYVSLRNGFGFINMIKGARFDDPKNEKFYYRINKEGENFVVTEEHGAKATFDPQNKTVSFTDFDTFSCISDGKTNSPNLISSIRNGVKSLTVSSGSFQPGKAVTFDLKPYTSIDFYRKGEDLYLPFNTFFDMTYHAFETVGLAYNYQNVYLLSHEELSSTKTGKATLSALGKSFYGGPKMATLTDEIKQYHYQEACFNFDYLYGLKKDKGFSSFAAFLEDKGLKNDVLSSDPKVVDSSLRYALSDLVDGHTDGATPSSVYEFGTAIDDVSNINAERRAWIEYGEDLASARKAQGLTPGTYLDERGKAFYISFDSFSTINDAELYGQSATSMNTAVLFNRAYKTLSSDETRAKVDTIVIDLLTNDGGAAEGMMYALCTLLGEVKTVTYSSVSGGENRSTYRADLNLDGKLDDSDVPLINKGYNIVFLNSKSTFSCGNAMPIIAKANNSKVITAGETSGGGACVVRSYFTALASGLSTSGITTIATESGGALTNVDKGIPADIALEANEFFNRAAISDKINQRLNKK